MIPKKHEKKMSNEARIAVLETTILNINATLIDIRHDVKHASEKMDSKFDSLEKKIDSKFDSFEKKTDGKFESFEKKMDSKFDSIQNRLWSNFLWLMGMIIGLAGLIAHTQHWI